MMENIKVKALNLSLISYRDDEAYYSYCPALELIGYGDNEQEAQDSFKIVLEEYIRYTTENQTLIEDLERLGWKKNGRNFRPPKIVDSLQKNGEFSCIFNKYDFVKRSIPVHIPFD